MQSYYKSERVVAKQSMTQAITQGVSEIAKAAMMVVREAETPVSSVRTI